MRSTRIVAGLAVVTLVAVSPELAPFDPAAPVAPSLQAPSVAHLLGTNHLGQDVLSRIMSGSRTTLAVAAVATAIAAGLGTLVGVGAGMVGGWRDALVMRSLDIVLAIPRLPLLMVCAAFIGADRRSLAILIGLLGAAPTARLLRAETRSLRSHGYVAMAASRGASVGYLLRCHIAPALRSLLAAQAVLVASAAVMLEASLAFIGLADPTGVSWGRDLERAMREPGLLLTDAWLWTVLPPGLAIAAVLAGLAIAGSRLDAVSQHQFEAAR